MCRNQYATPPFSLACNFYFLFLVELFLSIKVYFKYLWCTVFACDGLKLTKKSELVILFLNY